MRVCFAAVGVGVLAAGAAAQDGIAPATLTAVKEATVLITVTAGDGSASSGSGFLVGASGRTGYVLTNLHVVRDHDADAEGPPPEVRVVFQPGTRAERKAPADVVAGSREHDLALLRVEGVPDLPAPVDPGPGPEPVETMPVFIFGFPFGEELAPDRGRVAVVVGRGSVSSLRRDESGAVKSVVIDGALNPGNSGGPVVDARGRLVGVAVAAVRGAHIGFAIAPSALPSVLGGRVGGLKLKAVATRPGSAELAAEVALIDPLGTLKSVSLLVADGPAEGRVVSGKGDDPGRPIADARRVPLTLAGGFARGTFTVPRPADRGLDLVCQVAHTAADGKTAHSRPGRYLATADGPGGALRLWGEVVDPDGDGAVRVDRSGVSMEVPGTHHDLNCDIRRWNAPRVLHQVEGDFDAQVKVCGAYRPEGPSTRAAAYPCNGAGLFLWRDEENFIRLERFAVLRGGRTGAFLLFEGREAGHVNAKHNGPLEPGDVFLKLERRGGVVSGFTSADGVHWSEANPIDVSWPDRVTIGVDAVSSSSAPFPVRFEGFEVREVRP